jgi:hypothetical protein
VLSGIATREEADAHQPQMDFIAPTLADVLKELDGR